jgi:hypothetical protein
MKQQQQQQQQALHIPLLGDEQQSYEQDESSTGKEARGNNAVIVQNSQLFNAIFFSIAMPALLFLQFAFAFSRQHDNNNNNDMISRPTVNCNIGLFAATIWLYRWACRGSRTTNSLLLVLPEISTNAVLVILVFFDQRIAIATAFVALLVSIQLMSFIALVATVHCLFYSTRSCSKNNQKEEKQVDILIV